MDMPVLVLAHIVDMPVGTQRFVSHTKRSAETDRSAEGGTHLESISDTGECLLGSESVLGPVQHNHALSVGG